MKKVEFGAVHGRFQPLHNGHLHDYIIRAKERCHHLIIGITNPDPTHTLPDDSNLARTKPQNNPLTYFERLTMIQDAMLEVGVNRSEFTIVPFAINFPQLLKYYVPENTIHYLTVFDEWGRKKTKSLKSKGLKVKVLYEKDISEKEISSTMVREYLVKRKNWKSLVPQSTVDGVERFRLRERLLFIKQQLI